MSERVVEAGKRHRDRQDERAISSRPKRQRFDQDDDPDDSDNENSGSPGLSREDYTVGWVSALPLELAAAEAMLDERHDGLDNDRNDSNSYILGRIGGHNVVITCLPSGEYGTINAATVAANMWRSFPRISIRLMVGIGGGIPSKTDIRLGDVVVGQQVVQYDIGKTGPHGFQPVLRRFTPPPELKTVVSILEAKREKQPIDLLGRVTDMVCRFPDMVAYRYDPDRPDWLFDGDYDHADPSQDCESCDRLRLRRRPMRTGTRPSNPGIHYGIIASGNQVIKHGQTRDEQAELLGGAICFEMEAAGIMENFPSLVIRGICDYSDSHKNKKWQRFAAATSAAYAKEFLLTKRPASVALPPTAPLSARVSTVNTVLSDERRQCLLDSLRFEHIDSRHENIKDADPSTCKWLAKHEHYVNWLDPENLDDQKGFLWICGKPGVGKSTLVKFALKQKMAKKDSTTIWFFFNARGHYLEMSTTGMYRSLLYQLLRAMPNLQAVLADASPSAQPSWEIPELKKLFRRAVELLGDHQTLTCFVDALDECREDDVQDMVNFFSDELVKHGQEHGLKIFVCFSSRHYPTIVVPQGWRLVLEHEQGHTEDLDKYIRKKLMVKPRAQANTVCSEVLERSGSIFLWVVLVVDILNKEFRGGRIHAVRKRLGEIPNGLSELFQDIIQRDAENIDELQLSLLWILYAKRPLRREEFYFAVLSGLPDVDADSLWSWTPDEDLVEVMESFVMSSSKGLAEVSRIKEHTVAFIHESVRDWLVRDDGFRQLWPDINDDVKGFGHDRLRHSCHSYLTSDRLDALPSLVDWPTVENWMVKFPFLKYAQHHVLYHAEAAAANGRPQDSFLQEQFGTYNMRWRKLDGLLERYNTRRHNDDAPVVYLLAELGYTHLLRTWQSLHPGPIGPCLERYRHPLYAAVINGHEETVEAIKGYPLGWIQIPLKQKRYTPAWEWAVKEDLVRLVDFLLKNPNMCVRSEREEPVLDVNEVFRDGRRTTLGAATALGVAVRQENTALVDALLRGHADVDAADEAGRTPLMIAETRGHFEVMKRLLEHGAHIDELVLQYAKDANAIETILARLVEIGASIDHQDQKGTTALWRVVKGQGSLRLAEALLQNGANVDHRGQDDMTPLMIVAKEETSNIDTLELLLKYGAKVNARGGGTTALGWALRVGLDREIIECLLANGKADINGLDDSEPALTLFGVLIKSFWPPLIDGMFYRVVVIIQLLLLRGHQLRLAEGAIPLVSARAFLPHVDAKRHWNWTFNLGFPMYNCLCICLTIAFEYPAGSDGIPLPHFLAKEGERSTLELLLNRFRDQVPFWKDGRDHSPLFWAVQNKQARTFNLLLPYHADNMIGEAKGLWHLIDVAARNGDVYILNRLWDIYERQISSPPLAASLPVSATLSQEGQQSILQQFLDLCDAPTGPDGSEKWTALHAVVQAGPGALMWMLLRQADLATGHAKHLLLAAYGYIDLEAKWCLSDLELAISSGRVACHPGYKIQGIMAEIASGHEALVKTILECGEGVDVNAASLYGWTPLTYASSRGYTGIVKLLLKAGAIVNQPDVEYLVKVLRKRETREQTISSPKNLTTNDWNFLKWTNCDDPVRQGGLSPLAYAAAHGQTAVVEELLKAYAEVNAKDNHGATPLTLLARASRHHRGHLAAARLLLDAGATPGDELIRVVRRLADEEHGLVRSPSVTDETWANLYRRLVKNSSTRALS